MLSNHILDYSPVIAPVVSVIALHLIKFNLIWICLAIPSSKFSKTHIIQDSPSDSTIDSIWCNHSIHPIQIANLSYNRSRTYKFLQIMQKFLISFLKLLDFFGCSFYQNV